MTWFTILFCNVLSAGLCFILAKKRNSPPLGLSAVQWFLIGIPLGIVALLAMLAMPDKPEAENPQEQT